LPEFLAACYSENFVMGESIMPYMQGEEVIASLIKPLTMLSKKNYYLSYNNARFLVLYS